MRTTGEATWRRGWLAVLAVAACVSAAAAQDYLPDFLTVESWPATAASGPAEGVLPIFRAPTVEQALAFDPNERVVLEGDKPQLNTPALYVMLRRVEMLPTGSVLREKAENIDSAEFWNDPQRYRGRLVMVKGLYAGRTTDYSPHVTRTRWWGNRKVWMMDVFDPNTKRSMIVALSNEPPKIKPRTALSFPAVFLKLIKTNSETDPSMAYQPGRYDYPVFVAPSIFQPLGPSDVVGEQGNWTAMTGGIAVAGVLAVLVFGWLYVRKFAGKRAQVDATGRERRRRRLSDQELPEEEEPEPVDEELLRQVEQFKATHHDGKHDAPQNPPS